MINFLKKLKRALAFAIMGWSNYDWDIGYLHKLMLFKLKRMQHALINGVSIHEKTTLQSLRICIKLLERIVEDNYSYNTDRHDEKWGKAEFRTEPEPNSPYSRLIVHRDKVTPETEKQERLEFLAACRKDDERETRDIKLLHNIMAKYSRAWWD